MHYFSHPFPGIRIAFKLQCLSWYVVLLSLLPCYDAKALLLKRSRQLLLWIEKGVGSLVTDLTSTFPSLILPKIFVVILKSISLKELDLDSYHSQMSICMTTSKQLFTFLFFFTFLLFNVKVFPIKTIFLLDSEFIIVSLLNIIWQKEGVCSQTKA